MPADRLLASLLRSFQNVHSPSETSRLTLSNSLFFNSASLLATLSNPLNITLLTSQILTSTALWDHPDGLRVCHRVLGIFQSASLAILQDQETRPSGRQQRQRLDRTEWVKAVVKGADERSPRWKHLLPIAGLLLGFEGQGHRGLSEGVRRDLESALVLATNLAVEQVGRREDGLDGFCIALVLNYSFELLSDRRKRDLHYEDKSTTFFFLQRLSSRPLIASMGPFSRLVAHSVQSVRDPFLLHRLVDNIALFARTLTTQWRQNKLSEIDPSESSIYLDDQAMRFTIPLLWKVLRSAMFASVAILRAVMGRILLDRSLAADGSAPILASNVLHSLRNFYFITSNLGPNAFTTHNFVLLTAVDVLTTYPSHATSFIREIQPHSLGRIPRHPLDRTLDLFFLNTAEHFTFALSPQVNEEVLIAAVSPYLAGGHHKNLLEMFEAAHSVFLSVMKAPGNAELAGRVIPFYVDAVFKVCDP
ncbi:hypothetical protein GP486_008064 [Trichoglossum hirsutum]|uniref:Peroxisomal membrane protein PEX17 n=1 Tax=Trichoglossum hirsutum TaxID=265104 RepID=A0A9P8L6H0_9PEZI|nr:hypothetical protein GP486_008064 [Trichoglossum hirsutum]